MRFGLPRSDRRRKLDEFENLAKGSESVLFRVAYRLTGNAEDAKDLLQDGLVEAFEAFDKFRPNADFTRWVTRIMTNTFIDGTRRKAVRPVTVGIADLRGTEADSPEPDFPDLSPGPEESALSSEFQSLLNRALDRMPAEYRAALVLCDIEGFSYADAALAMRCPEGTVRSRLYRARRELRRCLGSYLLHTDEEAEGALR